jgi:hypothetical protein
MNQKHIATEQDKAKRENHALYTPVPIKEVVSFQHARLALIIPSTAMYHSRHQQHEIIC